MSGLTRSAEEIAWLAIKYLLEGIAVSVAAFYLSAKKTSIQQTLMIGASSAVVFLLLDLFAPSVGSASRTGAGYGIGLNRVGFGFEGYENEEDFEESFEAEDDY
jgi:ABC-type Co2+ transport system permease subunit